MDSWLSQIKWNASRPVQDSNSFADTISHDDYNFVPYAPYRFKLITLH